MERVLAEIGELGWAKVFVVGLVLVGLYYVAAFDDGSSIVTQIQTEKAKRVEAEATLRKTKAALADADRYEREVLSMISQYKHITDIMPEKLSAGDLTTLIGDLATKTGVTVKSTQPLGAGAKSDFFETMKIGFKVEGSFTQCASFLASVSQIPRLLTFDKLDLAASDRNIPGSSNLSMNATLVGYKYSKPAEPVNAKK